MDLIMRRRGMGVVEAHGGTLEVYPSSYTGLIDSIIDPQNGYTSYTSSNYATVTASSGNREIYFEFDTSSVPQGITITSATCTTKVIIGGSGKNVTMFNGSSLIERKSVSPGQQTVTFVFSDLSVNKFGNLKIRIHSNNADFKFYGATLTINYEFN